VIVLACKNQTVVRCAVDAIDVKHPMKAMRSAILLAVFVAPIPALAQTTDTEGGAMLRHAQNAVAAYHAGEPRSRGKLRVVYFVPSGLDPLTAYAERIDRIMTDVSNFYRDGLGRFGVAYEGLPLERERKGGKLVLHLVRGKLPADQYHHSSGDVAKAEIYAALRDTFDRDHEHVLVFYALCRKEPDGRYVFDAPYYGGGSERSGLCHAADCELLDPALLYETARKIVYTEHYYPRVEESIAEFNSKYLGGTAHELAHCFGLPHDSGSPAERRFGVSLMGRGNLNYRREVWHGGQPAYLARASALRLVSHPLVTGSNRGRWESADGEFESLRFSSRPGGVRIEGNLAGKIPAYAAIAYFWPTRSATDHGARTDPVVLKEGGSFGLDVDQLPRDAYHLKLAGLHANGSATTLEFPLTFDAAGKSDAAALNATWLVAQAENAVMARRQNARKFLTDQAISAAPTPEAKRKLRVLRGIVEPPRPIDLSRSTSSQVFLSDAMWTDARVGWGQVARNSFWFDDRFRNGVFLQLGGRFYDKGLYAHSPSRYAFTVNRQWKSFQSTVGLRDGAHAQGSAVFIVLGDGRELYRSRVHRVGTQESLNVNIASVKQLELQAEGTEGHTHNSWAIWVEPRVKR
jgi:hypothetical protein